MWYSELMSKRALKLLKSWLILIYNASLSNKVAEALIVMTKVWKTKGNKFGKFLEKHNVFPFIIAHPHRHLSLWKFCHVCEL